MRFGTPLKLMFLFVLAFLMAATSAFAEDRGPDSIAARPTKIFPGAAVENPKNAADVSAHGLFLGRVGTPGTRFDTGGANRLNAQIQDLSLQLTGNIDSIFSGNVVLGDLSTLTNNSDFVIGASGLIREAYVKTTSLPVASFKFGQFLANFGKNNRLYPHAQPMVDQPFINQELFGLNGFRAPGVELDLTIPSGWLFDISIAMMSARLVGAYSNPNDNTVVGVLRMEHEFEFGRETSFGFGGSASMGDNSLSQNTFYLGADATVKYKVNNEGFAFAWFNEFIWTDKGRNGLTSTHGFFTNPMFRFHPTFWAGLRFDYIGRVGSSTTGESAMIAWIPSTTSKWALQAGFQQQPNLPSNFNLMLQYNLTLGSNPPHAL